MTAQEIPPPPDELLEDELELDDELDELLLELELLEDDELELPETSISSSIFCA